MLRRLLLLIAAGFALSLQAEPVNFKINVVKDNTPEGPDVTRNYFSVDEKRIAFRMPQHCEVSSDSGKITVYVNENGASGQFSVTNSRFTPDADFVEKVEEYEKAADATIPKEAENLDSKSGRFDLYSFNGWKGLSFEWTYSFFAHPTQRHLAYINLDQEHQVTLLVIADDNSWKQTMGMAQRFVSSWYWLDSPAAPAVK